MFQIHGLSLTASEVVQLVGLLVPLVVAWLAHANAPSWFKGGLNAVLAALTGAIGVLVATDGGYDWQAFVQAILSALTASVVSYIAITKHIGGPQLEQSGLNLGKSLIMDITKSLPTDAGPKHAVGDPLPADQTPPTGNVITPPKGDAGAAPVGSLAYILIVLGIVGLVIGLIAPHVASLASAHWMLTPGIVLLVVGVILALIFGPWRGSWGPGPRV